METDIQAHLVSQRGHATASYGPGAGEGWNQHHQHRLGLRRSDRRLDPGPLRCDSPSQYTLTPEHGQRQTVPQRQRSLGVWGSWASRDRNHGHLGIGRAGATLSVATPPTHSWEQAQVKPSPASRRLGECTAHLHHESPQRKQVTSAGPLLGHATHCATRNWKQTRTKGSG